MKFRRHSFKERREFAVQDQLAAHTPLYKETLPDFYSSLQERLSVQKEMLSLLQDALRKINLIQEELDKVEAKQTSFSAAIPESIMGPSLVIEVDSISSRALLFYDEDAKIRLNLMDDVLTWQSKFLKSNLDFDNHLRDDVYKKLFLGV